MPDFSLERELFSSHPSGLIACLDEVGRGAIAGPVCVGITLLSFPLIESDTQPEGMRDSKQLSSSARERIAPLARMWAPTAVGYASAQAVDAYGIMTALTIAAGDAYAKVSALAPRHPACSIDGQYCSPALSAVLIDGNIDWWQAPFDLFRAGGNTEQTLVERQQKFTEGAREADTEMHNLPQVPSLPSVPVYTQVKGDASCLSLACASICAKVERDHYMEKIAHTFPEYRWEKNKGYGTIEHKRAIKEYGLTPYHRASWHI